jgi:predicted dehydrogenase
MTETIRVGILGAGWAAESHAIAFSQLPHVEVTALWSRTRTSAEVLGQQLNQPVLRVYDNWQELIEQAGVDVISVATPPMLRREPIMMALERGCHILIEKPFSVGLADAQAMTQAAQVAKTVTATCFIWRYAPAYQVAWRAVQEGHIGRIHDVRSEWRWRVTARDFFVKRPWVGRMDIADGTLAEGLSHDFDKARFLTGLEFTHIVSQIMPLTIKSDADFPIEGGLHMHLTKLADGVVGNFQFTVTSGEGKWQFILSGDEGTLILNQGDAIRRQRADEDEPVPVEIPLSDQLPAGVDLMQHTWNRLIADFIQAIRQGGRPGRRLGW